jgi:hypothetical protein
MAMLHIENIDISENTDFFNDISKNDIRYKSPALVSTTKYQLQVLDLLTSQLTLGESWRHDGRATLAA